MKAILNKETMNQEIKIEIALRNPPPVFACVSEFFQSESMRFEREEEMIVIEQTSSNSWTIIGCYGEDVEDYYQEVLKTFEEQCVELY